MASLAGLLVLLTLLAPCALAQDAVLYRLFQRGTEVGRETVRLLSGGYELSVVVPLLQMRMDSRTTFDASGRVARFTARLMPPGGDSVQAEWTVAGDPDSARVTITRGTQTGRVAVAGRADLVIPAQTIGLMAIAAQRAAGRDTVFRALAMGLDTAMPIPVHFHGDSVTLRLGPLAVHAARTRWPTLEVPLSQVRGEVWNGRDSLPPLSGMRRPASDYTAPPDAPYTAEEVRVPVRTAAGDSFSLGCTLTRPRAGGPRFPAVVTATGSGGQDRDEYLWPLLEAYRPFRQVADRLAREGIAVLRCDDRGVGASGGPLLEATTADFAGDVRAQVAWLRARADIARSRVAIVGHSEGGVIAPMVAADDPELRAIVLMAGTAKPGRDVLRYQVVERAMADTSLPSTRRDSLRPELERTLAGMLALNPWMRFFADYDPLTAARRVRQPVLILQGALDRQVTADQAGLLAAALRGSGNRDVTVRVYPRLNHLFLYTDGDGSPAEYPGLREQQLPREVLDELAGWLMVRLAN